MRIVVALGGNALLRRGERATIEMQIHNVARAVAAIAQLRKAGHQIVLTHGNGPQVGMLALQAASTPDTPYPLDVLDAESEGMIGYLIEQALMYAVVRLTSVDFFNTRVAACRVTEVAPVFWSGWWR